MSPKSSKTNVTPKEDWEQRQVVIWLRNRRIPFFATVNQQQMSMTNRRIAAIMQSRMKALGLTPGVYDLCVFLPDKFLHIEMKRVKGGVVSKEQKAWGQVVNKFSYVDAIVCRGHEEAIKAIRERV